MRPARTRLIDDVLGVVLVGGASSRFGSDKASASFRGRPLMHHALHTLQRAGLAHLAYVGGQPRAGLELVAAHVADLPDTPQCTLRGVVAALQHAAPRWSRVMLLACDVPLASSDTVSRVLSALGSDADHSSDDTQLDAAVARGERDHWSCIAVRSAALERLRVSLRDGERAMHRAFAPLRVCRVPVDEREFANVNTRDDLAKLITDDASDRG